MMKKITALLLVAVMALSLAACGDDPVENTSYFDENGNFVPSKDIKLSVWETQGTDFVSPKTINDNVVEKWLTEKTGVTFDTSYGNGGSQWEAKLNLLLAGDNLPNIIHIGGGQGPAHLARLKKADKIWELTPEMIQTYAPNIWEKVPESMWEKMKIDGKIYGIPYSFNTLAYNEFESLRKGNSEEEIQRMLDDLTPGNNVTAAAYAPLGIRDDVLKQMIPSALSYEEIDRLVKENKQPMGNQLILEEINSTEAYKNFMYQVKDLGLTQNGKPVFAMGLDGGDLWFPLTYFGGEYAGYQGRNYITTWDTENEKITMPLLEDVTKNVLRDLNKMIRDKVIDPESLMHSSAQYKEKVLAGQYVITNLSNIGGMAEINKLLADRGATFRYVPFIANVPNMPGYETIAEESGYTGWQKVVGILTSTDEADIPQILNFMNTMFSDEFDEVRFWGPKEAGLYTEAEDGTRTFKDPKLQDFVVNNNTAALPVEESMGLSTAGKTYLGPIGAFYPMAPSEITRWNPIVVNNIKTYTVESMGAKFPIDDPHVTAVVRVPNYQIWDPIFANNELVQKFWSSRAQWEDPFKIPLTADSDEEFEEKWQEAYNTANSIVDIPKMLEEMTEITKAQQ